MSDAIGRLVNTLHNSASEWGRVENSMIAPQMTQPGIGRDLADERAYIASFRMEYFRLHEGKRVRYYVTVIEACDE